MGTNHLLPPAMVKPPHLWVTAAADARVLVPRRAGAVLPARQGIPVHLSLCCQGAELAGPWLIRAALRIPVTPGAVMDAALHRSRWMGALHVRWLRYMGVRFASLYEGPTVGHWSSFAGRLAGDVLVGGQKICSVGELRQSGNALLFASTLLHPPPWPTLCQRLERDAGEAVALERSAVAASSLVARRIDEAAWAANLRSMLHLAVSLSELRHGIGVDA